MKESREEGRRKIVRNNERKKGWQLVESKSDSLEKEVNKNLGIKGRRRKEARKKISVNVKKARGRYL